MIRRARRAALVPFLTLVCLLWSGPSAAREIPFLSGRFVDEAGLLDEAGEQALEDRLARLEAETGAQLVVLTIPSLQDEVLEDYSLRVAETWGLGSADRDDGVLFLVAVEDRKMRLEVGYGLEPVLTDALSGRILRNVVRPRFRDGDMAGGIEAGVEAVASVIAGTPADHVVPREAPGQRPSGGEMLLMAVIFLCTVGLFSVMALATPGCISWFLYLFLAPFWTLFPLVFVPGGKGWIAGVIWLLAFPILRPLIRRTGFGDWMQDHAGGGFPMVISGRGGGWSGGGGFGGGFSGGGGSFGGGGASSGW